MDASVLGAGLNTSVFIYIFYDLLDGYLKCVVRVFLNNLVVLANLFLEIEL